MSSPWSAWFPSKLDPVESDRIGAEWWDRDPHYAAHLAWTSYAASLPPAVPVSSVGTGSQSVGYSPAAVQGELGAAMARADWHLVRSHTAGGLNSLPLGGRPLPDFGYVARVTDDGVDLLDRGGWVPLGVTAGL